MFVADVLAVVAGVPAEAKHTARAPRWLTRVRSAIDDSGAWPTVGELAALGSVHRVYLAKQFRRFYGCAVSDYVRRRRVQLAAQHMLRSAVSLSEIAHDAGFSDHAHMCRAFRNETGITPRSFRQLGSGTTTDASSTAGSRSTQRTSSK
jgi:AraC-like DNA-binding protein